MEAFLGKRTAICILVIASVLLFPSLCGYSFITSWGYPLFAFCGLSSAYSFFSRELETNSSKIASALIGTLALFFVLGIGFFFDGFSGSQTVERKWDIDNYRIEYIKDQGFAGSPRMNYELSKYALVPIYFKKEETTLDNDTIQSCVVNFTNSGIFFDKCSGVIKH